MTVMKKCCGLCPYSKKNTLYLHPERAEEFAYMAQNPYTDFVCHKTGVIYEDDEWGDEIVRGEKSLTCAGFHAMQMIINGSEDSDECEIEIDWDDHFSEESEMIWHHENHHEQSLIKK